MAASCWSFNPINSTPSSCSASISRLRWLLLISASRAMNQATVEFGMLAQGAATVPEALIKMGKPKAICIVFRIVFHSSAPDDRLSLAAMIALPSIPA